MKTAVLTFLLALLSFNTLADSDAYICTLDDYQIIFDFDRYRNTDMVFVEVLLDGEIIDAHTTKKNVHRDSHGDSWGMDLEDTLSRNNKYELFFNADYLMSAYITMPGYDQERTTSCSYYRVQ